MAKRIRSPNYPAIDLNEAISRVRQLYAEEKINPTTVSVASAHWGYKSIKTGGSAIIAALNAYGLVDTEGGTGEQKQVRVSNLARRIILDERPDSRERVQLLKEAALRPKLHTELWDKWASNLPSDVNIAYHLVADRGFNEKTVEGFIAGYKASLDFAELINNGKLADGGRGEKENETASSSGSAALFRQILQAPKAQESHVAPTARPRMNQDTFTLDEGQVVLQWPADISAESYDDLKAWLDLITRRMKRTVTTGATGEEPDQDERTPA